ncbi:MAG: hypothetical protein ACD_80C00079G0005 [uncultured bacterium (gcode 4)]|uniref:Uncharacterized protein n=1 Tax=uncultured bacterium (gcode 4) TaxID=1234023 RepID=K1XJI6_9BACT|nr:MAG: hypothetical protein ACD_80C00079G0005 [uncultured bacterium (gcode 4)]
MNLTKKNIVLLSIASILFFLLFVNHTLLVNAWDVSLQIKWMGIRHGTPDNVNLWLLTASGNDQEINGQFSGYFWVEDIEGYITGHYTTIQCEGVYGPLWNKLTWVYLKAGNINPERILWLTGNVLIAPSFADYTSILSPMTYIYKPTALGNAWIVNKYWDKPWLKIVVPGGTPPGTYSGTIVFSFYMY